MKDNGHCVRIVPLLAVVLTAVAAPQAQAVMVSTTLGNTTAPADDFGFANVGIKNDATGVYLGYRWVLTASHAGISDIVLNGRTYHYETGTSVRLKNPTGLVLTTSTDLSLFRITEDPWLPTLKIADEHLNVWDEVIMVGNGLNRYDQLKGWDITGTYDGDDPSVWTLVDPPEAGDAQGYITAGTKTLRWGTNRVEPGMEAIRVNDADVITFHTDFDQLGGTECEAQAAGGDSGGGVFHKNGAQWELVGTINAVSQFPNQPSLCIFGLETYCADLVEYRDQILNAITPLGGDANLDGVVDAADASIMAANWGRSGNVFWGHGDFNEDGVIDTADAAILAENWGTSKATAPQSESAPAMPEPPVVALLLAALAGWLARRDRA